MTGEMKNAAGPIVGIDLGTTNSLVAVAGWPAPGDGPRVLVDEAGRGLFPSAVRFEAGGATVAGHEAKARAVEFPLSTVVSVKRLMGRSLQDAAADLKYLSYEVVEGENKTARVRIPGDGAVGSGVREVSPQEVSAIILRALKEQASRALGVPVSRAVITVPAYFDDAQRQATRDAARLAGLEAVRLVAEPTAAALAYGLGLRSPGGTGEGATRDAKVVAVYDLGGGTFDVSVLRITPSMGGEGDGGGAEAFQVLSTSGDTHLGGDDFDYALVSLFTREIGERFFGGRDVGAELSPTVRRELRDFAEHTKIRLSEADEARVEIDLGEDTSGGAGVPPASPGHAESEEASALRESAEGRRDACPTPKRDQRLGGGKNLAISIRRLPHFEQGGSTYFVTWRLRTQELSFAERQIVLDACRHWDGDRLTLYAVTVMPDHVHMVFEPLEKAPGQWHRISDILHSIKSFTAHAINKLRGTRGTVWQDESYDHIIRGPDEYMETVGYLQRNPERKGLVQHWMEYPFTWVEQMREDTAQRGAGVPPASPGQAETEEASALRESAGGRRDACPTLGKPARRVYSRVITRAEFEAMIEPLVERTIVACKRAMRDAKRMMEGESLAAVVMVGGSTRVPRVRARVKEVFGVEPYVALDPDIVVALGAAVQGSILSGARRDALLLDVVPLSLGIETAGGAFAKIVMRGATIPAMAGEMFSTQVDGQTSIKLQVLQGEREMAADCRSLGTYHLRGIPPMPAGIPQLRVEFRVDSNGVLSVSAMERRSGKRLDVQIVPTHGLTRGEVERLERESFTHARDDMRRHRLADLVANSKLDLHWIGQQMARHGAKLDAASRGAIEGAIGELRELVDRASDPARSDGVEPDAFQQAKERLDRASVGLHEVSISESLKGE